MSQSAHHSESRERSHERKPFTGEAIGDVEDVGEDDDDNDDSDVKDDNVDSQADFLEVGMYSEELQVALNVVYCVFVFPVKLGRRAEGEEKDLVELDEEGEEESPEGGGNLFQEDKEDAEYNFQ